MKDPRDAFPADSFKWSAEICGAVVMGISLLGLVGWSAKVQFLSNIIPGGIPMAPSTACSFLLSGTMLCFRTKGVRSAWVRAGAMVVAVFGLLNFLEPFIGVDLSFEEVLFPATERFGAVLTNRMSPLTGLIFFLAGINLVLLLGRKDQASSRHLGGFLGTLVALGGFIGFLGYLFGTPLLSGGVIIPMAFSTTCSFLLLGLGLMARAGPDVLPLRLLARPLTQAKLLRAFLPLTVGVILFQGLMNKFIPDLFHNYALGVVLVALLFAILTGVLVTLVGRTLGLALDRATVEREQADQELRIQKEIADKILDNIPVMIAFLDAQGKHQWVNQRWEKTLGWSMEEALNRDILADL